jgi:hypothetical protein
MEILINFQKVKLCICGITELFQYESDNLLMEFRNKNHFPNTVDFFYGTKPVVYTKPTRMRNHFQVILFSLMLYQIYLFNIILF